jgi:hypothetical protein
MRPQLQVRKTNMPSCTDVEKSSARHNQKATKTLAKPKLQTPNQPEKTTHKTSHNHTKER